jgi:hypothetical protein
MRLIDGSGGKRPKPKVSNTRANRRDMKKHMKAVKGGKKK